MKNKVRFLILITISFIAGSSCTQNFQYTLESIAAPVNVSLSQDGSEYDLTFTSDNREANFAGYGIFTGISQTQSEANTSNDIDNFTSDNTKCFVSLSSSSISYTDPTVKIRLNTSSLPSGYHGYCTSLDLSIISGNYLSIRAYVNRESDVWSNSASVLIP